MSSESAAPTVEWAPGWQMSQRNTEWKLTGVILTQLNHKCVKFQVRSTETNWQRHANINTKQLQPLANGSEQHCTLQPQLSIQLCIPIDIFYFVQNLMKERAVIGGEAAHSLAAVIDDCVSHRLQMRRHSAWRRSEVCAVNCGGAPFAPGRTWGGGVGVAGGVCTGKNQAFS